MHLNATRDGPDAAAVQTQLKAALESALGDARRSAQAGQMDVRTGNFALFPRYGRDGKMSHAYTTLPHDQAPAFAHEPGH